MVYPLLILVLAFVVILMAVQPSRAIYIRRVSFPALCILFTLCLVIFSDTAAKAALKGLNLWSSAVVPSLLPFFIASELLNSSGFINVAGTLLEPVMRPLFRLPGCSSLALALGVTSGYPVGARITADLRKSGALTRTEAERLLAFTNNSGPLFIIGAVGTGMLGSPAIGRFLFACHLLACITIGLVFRFYRRSEEQLSISGDVPHRGVFSRKAVTSLNGRSHNGIPHKIRTRTEPGKNPGTLIADAVRNSVSTLLSIGGFIVLFSVVISFLETTGIIGMVASAVIRLFPGNMPKWDAEGLVSGVLNGFLEITNGTGAVSRCVNVPLKVKLPAISFIAGWAGISVHLQVMGIVSGTDMNIRPYLLGKFLQGIAAAIYTRAGMELMPAGSIIAQPALGLPRYDMYGFFQTMGRSVWMLAMVILTWIIIATLIRLLKNVKKKSPT